MRASTDLFMVLAIQCYFSALVTKKLSSYSQTVKDRCLKTYHFIQKQGLWGLEAEYGHTDYFPSTYQEGTCSYNSVSI